MHINNIFNYSMVTESIPWLVANNRKVEADKIMHKAGKVNGITLPEYIFASPAEDVAHVRRRRKSLMLQAWEKFKAPGAGTEKKYNASFSDMFKSSVLRTYILVLAFGW